MPITLSSSMEASSCSLPSYPRFAAADIAEVVIILETAWQSVHDNRLVWHY